MKFANNSLLACIVWRAYFLLTRLLRPCLGERKMQGFMRFCRNARQRYFSESAVPLAGKMPDVLDNLSASPVVPSWIVDELHQLAAIEPALYPKPALLGRYHAWQPGEDTYAAHLYKQLLDDFITSRPQIVFLVPHMMRGGADLGVLHHVRLCLELGWRVTVVLTRDVESPWVHRLPVGARVVEYGQMARHASEEDRRLVLLRLLLQSPATTIHLINSQIGWQIFAEFGKALISSGKQLYASLYCDDYDRNGIRCGYATDYLPTTWPSLHGIITDNERFKMDIRQRDGVPSERLHSLYFPYVGKIADRYRGGKRILWAGRLAAQKRPQLLQAIAAANPDIYFDVFGEIDPGADTESVRRLQVLPNVRLAGSFDDFSHIAGAGDYAAFLYTSAYDGLPNVLLEAAAAGLPIVAPDVGGVSELISGRCGYLLPELADADAFAQTLREVLDNLPEAVSKALNAQAVVRERHSWSAFKENLLSIPGYAPSNLQTIDTVALT